MFGWFGSNEQEESSKSSSPSVVDKFKNLSFIGTDQAKDDDSSREAIAIQDAQNSPPSTINPLIPTSNQSFHKDSIAATSYNNTPTTATDTRPHQYDSSDPIPQIHQDPYSSVKRTSPVSSTTFTNDTFSTGVQSNNRLPSSSTSSFQFNANQQRPSSSTSSFQFNANPNTNFNQFTMDSKPNMPANHPIQSKDFKPKIQDIPADYKPMNPSELFKFNFPNQPSDSTSKVITQELQQSDPYPSTSSVISPSKIGKALSFGIVGSPHGRNQENLNPNNDNQPESTLNLSTQIKQSLISNEVNEVNEVMPNPMNPTFSTNISNANAMSTVDITERVNKSLIKSPQSVEPVQPSQVSQPVQPSQPSQPAQTVQTVQSKKSRWKQQYNELIRGGKTLEKERDYLAALKKYLKAANLSQKEQPKLQTKIAKVRDICTEHELHETEEAFELINDPWYINVVTENYHLERTKKQENEFDEDDEEEEEEEEETLEYILPGEVYEKLYDYQRDALVWFWKVYQSPNGGILGDDMGLGKTVQMSAYLNGAFYSGLIRCVLLIVPVSVMAHWIKELDKWCNFTGFRIKKYHSSVTKKRRQLNLESIAKKGGILITTYGMVQKNFAAMDIETLSQKERNGRVVRPGKAWDYMVLDEGHKIKNHLIGTSKAVRQIPVHNSNRIILSGTFLQNELSELWSLFDFISEGSLFGSYRAFNEEFATKINSGRLKNASRIQKQLSVKLTNLIKKTIAPYLLRRTKQGVRARQQEQEKKEEADIQQRKDDGLSPRNNSKKEMTPVLKCQKRELVVWIKMTEVQTDIYRTFLESEAVKETLNTTKSPLAALTVLKKICDHPFLLSDKMANCQELTQLADISRDRGVSNTVATSTKMQVLIQVLKELMDHQHRVLVFSQYKIILSMIEPILKENGMKYIRMDGDTKIENRQKYVDAFNTMTQINVFLLSTKVGGLGLNLTGSDRVIIYDPAWNPATDAQAVDRSYRIGQVNDVMVYRFVTCGTIEEKIYRRQISKVGLLKSVTGNSNQQRYFSKAELKEVFKLEDPTMSQTQIQFKQLHEHRVGTNAEFDRETLHVEGIESVYGISHHDLLFKTCPPEELEENPELAGQLEEVRRRLCVQTPKPRNRRNRGSTPSTEQRINDILRSTPRPNRPRLPEIAETAVVKRRDPNRNHNVRNPNPLGFDSAFDLNSNLESNPPVSTSKEPSSEPFSFKFDDNYSEQISTEDLKTDTFKTNAPNPFLDPDRSNSMDLDDDDDATESEGEAFLNKNEQNNISFISNISSIAPPDRRSLNHNQQPNRPMTTTPAIRAAPDSSVKRTRTLRKKQNRFLADSDTDEESVDPNGSTNTRKFLNKLDRFQFTPAPNPKAKRVGGGRMDAIAMTPIFQGLLPKQSVPAQPESPLSHKPAMQLPVEQQPSTPMKPALDEDIEIKDIAKVIRSQPRKKRRKSLANLQQLMEAADEEEEQEECTENQTDQSIVDHEESEHPQMNQEEQAIYRPNISKQHNVTYDSEATVSESEEEQRPLRASQPSRPQSQHPSILQNSNNFGQSSENGMNHNSVHQSFVDHNRSVNDTVSTKMPIQNIQSAQSSFMGQKSFGADSGNIAPNFGNLSMNTSHRTLQPDFRYEAVQNNVDSHVNTSDPMEIEEATKKMNKSVVDANQSSFKWQQQTMPSAPSTFERNSPQNKSALSSSFTTNQAMSFSMDQPRGNSIIDLTADSPARMVTQPSSNANQNQNQNPYVDDDLMKDLHQFSPFKNRSFVDEHKAKLVENVKPEVPRKVAANNISWNFNTTNLSDFVSPNLSRISHTVNNDNVSKLNRHADDDESTLSDEDMFDREVAPLPNVSVPPQSNVVPSQPPPPQLDESMTVEQIFNGTDKLEQEASILYEQEAPKTVVSSARTNQLNKSFRRYRRKSFVPTMDAMDDHLEDEQDELEEEEESVNDNVGGQVTVCDEHRRKSKALEGFEFECTKCECYLTALEKSAYRNYVNLANEAEAREEWMTALENLMNALMICNSDVTLHTRCQVIGSEHLQF